MTQGDGLYTVVRVRDVDAGRMEQVLRLREALMVHDRRSVPPAGFERFMAERLGDDTTLLCLALAGAEAVGYGLAFDVAQHPFMPEWQRSGYITQFFVAPAHRRRGVGDMLLGAIDDWFASRGITRVLLNVSIDNALGERFWRRHGFQAQAVRMRRVLER